MQSSLAQGTRLVPARLGELVGQVAAADQWPAAVMFDTSRHWYRRLELTDRYEVWLLTWLPGQHTGFHDHGEAAGAFIVVQGELEEALARPGSLAVRRRATGQGSVRTFGARHLHDVSNVTGAPAVSVHAYSPPLTAMRRYQMETSGLTFVGTDIAELDW